MTFPLTYGQHPTYAMPARAWPVYARVGFYVELAKTSGVKRLAARELVFDTPDLQQAIKEDQELFELIKIIVESGLLE